MRDPNTPDEMDELPEWQATEPRRPSLVGPLLVSSGLILAVAALVFVLPDGESDTPSDVPGVTVTPQSDDDPVHALEAAQARVRGLEEEIEARKIELEGIRTEGENGRAKAEADLERLKGSLAKAERQRDDLRKRLTTALAALDTELGAHAVTRERVVALETANTENVYAAFTQGVKLDVCQQWTRGAREKCHDKVDLWFDDARQDRFASCVQNREAVPALFKRERKEAVPTTAEPLGIGVLGERKDWYVVFCDPTLPERAVAMAP